jgi:hypothetical protein
MRTTLRASACHAEPRRNSKPRVVHSRTRKYDFSHNIERFILVSCAKYYIRISYMRNVTEKSLDLPSIGTGIDAV